MLSKTVTYDYALDFERLRETTLTQKIPGMSMSKSPGENTCKK